MPDDEDDVDFFPSTSRDCCGSAEGSNASSESDQETLLELKARKSKALKKKQSGRKVTKDDHPMKSKNTRKKKSSGEPISACSCSFIFGSEELLLVSKAFMKVLNNAKHSMDKKADKFWDEAYVTFEELVASANKMNETNTEFASI
jgi:hypothetical protein